MADIVSSWTASMGSGTNAGVGSGASAGGGSGNSGGEDELRQLDGSTEIIIYMLPALSSSVYHTEIVIVKEKPLVQEE